MNIGFVSTWYERGAAYVTRQYIELLKDNHSVFVLARGGEKTDAPEWQQEYVTYARVTPTYFDIFWSDFSKWIRKNKITVVLFNEQQNWDIIFKIKKNMPELIIGSYIDYYRRDTVQKHKMYDFLICNTKRHYSVFDWHPQCYYVPWGTDTDLYEYKPLDVDGKDVVFFHSAGMSDRKGTARLLETFVSTDLCTKSKLIIHAQFDLVKKLGYDYEALKKKNVEIIEKTVAAPGLYYMGNVYVYPAELDGLGLTIYEALSSGMPVVATDVAPINEPIEKDCGRFVKVEKTIAREDGYYWPLSLVDKDSLYEEMNYYVLNKEALPDMRERIRDYACERLHWQNRKQMVNDIFSNVRLQKQWDESYIDENLVARSVGQKLDYSIRLVIDSVKRLLGIVS